MPKFDVTKKQLVVAMDHGRALGTVAAYARLRPLHHAAAALDSKQPN